MRFLALFSLLLLLAQCDDPDPNKPVLYMYVPSYGNQSTNGSYHLRFYGVIYQREDDNGFNNIFDGLFDDDDITDLNPTNARERANLNFTLDPFLHWELLSDQIITFNVQNRTDASTTKETSIDGQFDEFVNVQLNLTNLPQTIYYQAINPDDDGNLLGNITVHGPTGYSIMSDIDDVLRVTKAWEPQGLVNTFVKDMVAVDGMPQLFNQWKSQLNPAFHYCTETPIPLAGVLLRWMYTLYPFGSLDLRPVNILESDELLGARKDQVFRLAETYPNRKFILVGDTSSESVVRAFPEFARTFPNQTVCVFIKNTTAQFPHFFNPLVDLKKEFEGVPPEKWFVFDKASDLRSIVIQSGICRPPGIPINQTTISGGFGGTVTDAAHALTVHITLLVVFLMVLLA